MTNPFEKRRKQGLLSSEILDEITEDAITEWNEMPEYKHGPQEVFHELTIRFAKEEDLNEFAKLINQTVTNRTKSIWYPKLIKGLFTSRSKINYV